MGKCSGEVEDMYKRKDTINITITITVTIKTTYIGPIGRTAVTFTHEEWDAQKQCYLDR